MLVDLGQPGLLRVELEAVTALIFVSIGIGVSAVLALDNGVRHDADKIAINLKDGIPRPAEPVACGVADLGDEHDGFDKNREDERVSDGKHGRSVDNHNVVELVGFVQHAAHQGGAEQLTGVRGDRAAAGDIDACAAQRLPRGLQGRLVGEDAREPNVRGDVEVGTDGGAPEVSVDEQDIEAGPGAGQGQVGRKGGFALTGR